MSAFERFLHLRGTTARPAVIETDGSPGVRTPSDFRTLIGVNVRNLALDAIYSAPMDGTQKTVFATSIVSFSTITDRLQIEFQFDTNYSGGASRTYELYFGDKRIAKFTHAPGTSGVRATVRVCLAPIAIDTTGILNVRADIVANGTTTAIAPQNDTDLDQYVLVTTNGNLSTATGYWTTSNVDTQTPAAFSFRATGPSATNVECLVPTAHLLAA